ncbi:MAG: hypothetical protein ACR2N4_14165 [Jatrophihabitans sp.]
MSSPDGEQAGQGEDVLARIEAALAELDDPATSKDLPLAELATRLGGVHTQLQAALAELDRA